MTQSFRKLEMEGYCLNLICGIYKKPIANKILSDERLKGSKAKISTPTRCYTAGPTQSDSTRAHLDPFILT